MFRSLICVAVVAAFSLSFAAAQDAGGKGTQPGGKPMWVKIVKVDGDKVVVREYDAKTKEFGKERELTTGEKLKVFQYGKDNKQLPVTGGLKGEPFQNLGKEGAYGRINMQGTNVGEIYLYSDQGAWQKGMQPLPGTGGTGKGALGGGQDRLSRVR